ncbi:MAG: imidazole glycerol phosphate synthase subunit HisH [Clostridiaceae bacterium]|jgi:glutamine amidotransferase|nr:imidazole glycerol phosphate synthase subunit HisH [Clostridiaceae bacterium]
MLIIIDYGVGNLFSLSSSLKSLGVESKISDKKADILHADRVILPGVGAFEDAARKLRASGLDVPLYEVVNDGKPLLGICLGMQMLFDKSFEYGEHAGLGLIPGTVRAIEHDLQSVSLKIPHMGWNALRFTKPSPLFKYNKDSDYVYFVHSYYARDCAEDTLAYADYGIPLTAAVGKKNVFGTQFHPEKSGTAGLKILKAFSEL